MSLNQCSCCGHYYKESTCPIDGIAIGPQRKPRFKLTPEKIKSLRGLAHGVKGLSNEDYYARLNALGFASTKELTRRRDYEKVWNNIKRLPNVRRAA